MPDSNDNFDVIIVGGGIAGSAMAAVLARAGRSVLVLEQSEKFEDRVRGEFLAQWGVKEAERLGLLDVLVAAGGHYLSQSVYFADPFEPAVMEAAAVALDIFVAGVPGPLCLGHPHHCQTLFDEAKRAGATMLRGVVVEKVEPGSAPSVAYRHDGRTATAKSRLIVGADARTSVVRQACGLALHQDKPHHWMGGMLVERASGWKENRFAIGTEKDFNFLVFPQGNDRVRAYGCWALEQRTRFSGPDGPAAFLNAFRIACCPDMASVANGRAAGPLFSYFNNDSWIDTPFVEGAVLIGDAAGWNDPIIGQGLSIAYRDVRIVSDILLASDNWSPAVFSSYAEERRERLRRLRFVAEIVSRLDAEFDATALERRTRWIMRSVGNPGVMMHIAAALAGPEALPAEIFTPQYRASVLDA
jgi:2-polyprenyl-6-methoxyphenol hydroxylase-like FAD-dependent oxidoreductase